MEIKFSQEYWLKLIDNEPDDISAGQPLTEEEKQKLDEEWKEYLWSIL